MRLAGGSCHVATREGDNHIILDTCSIFTEESVGKKKACTLEVTLQFYEPEVENLPWHEVYKAGAMSNGQIASLGLKFLTKVVVGGPQEFKGWGVGLQLLVTLGMEVSHVRSPYRTATLSQGLHWDLGYWLGIRALRYRLPGLNFPPATSQIT